MKRIALLAALALMGCDPAALPGGGGTGSTSTSSASAVREFLVIGNSMTFEECRAGGGLIIQDQGSPMTACDPSVKGRVAQVEGGVGPDATDAQAAREAEDLQRQQGG